MAQTAQLSLDFRSIVSQGIVVLLNATVIIFILVNMTLLEVSH